MDKRLEQAINEQITKELYSSYLYLGMVGYFEELSLKGFGHWMRIQVQEEALHAMKFFDYLYARGAKAVLASIDMPSAKYTSAQDVFAKTLAHEQAVTASINALYNVAREVNDNAAMSFLQWFVDEQVEEESNASEILAKLKLAENHPAGILFLDKELVARPQPVIV